MRKSIKMLKQSGWKIWLNIFHDQANEWLE